MADELLSRAARAARFVAEYELAAHKPDLAARVLAMDVERPIPWILETLEADLAPFQRYHEATNPFVTAPPAALAVGGVAVLRQEANNATIPFALEELARSILVAGSSGSGKTALLLHLAEAMLRAGVRMLIIDVKGDYHTLAAVHDDLLVLDHDAPVDLLAVPPYLSRTEHVAILVEALARTLWGGQSLRAVAHEVFTRAYQSREHPTWQDVQGELAALRQPRDTTDRRSAINNFEYRIQRLLERYPGIANGTVPVHRLCDESVLCSFLQYGDLEDLLVTTLVQHRFLHHRAHGIRALRTMIFFDEMLLAFRDERARIAGNPLVDLQGLTREFGLGWALSVNTASELPSSLSANVFALIALNVASSTEVDLISKTCGLSPRQREYYAYHLTRGQALVRLADRWRKPILARYDPWPHKKTVSASDWNAARERIHRIARPSPPTTAARLRLAAAIPPPPPAARPPSSPGVHDTVPPRVALNAHTTALLRYVADHPFTLCTPAYRACQLLLAQGDRARAQAERLGLLAADRVVTGRGRGKTGIALHLTPAGWEWLGRTPTKGLRAPSSAQHSYCTYALARRILGAVMEETLGTGKSIDLVIPFNAERHEQFYRAISGLTGKTPALRDGDMIAIEIEITSRKTARNNATKNAAAGVALTILAIADRTPEHLARNLPPNAVVVDAYALLDALKEHR